MVDYAELWKGKYKTRNRNRMMPHIAMGCFETTWQKFDRAPFIERSVIDWGCGNGYAAEIFDSEGWEYLSGIDITRNAFNEDIMFKFGPAVFMESDIVDAKPYRKASMGYCADVLEHLPEDKVVPAVENIIAHSNLSAFISVGTKSDKFYGQELHETQKPPWWWEETLEKYGNIDIIGGIKSNGVMFYYLEF